MKSEAKGAGLVEGEFLKMVREFLELGMDRLETLEDACRRVDFRGMMDSSDAVKDTTLYSGFCEICECAAEIGRCARERNPDGVIQATNRMQKNFRQIVGTLVFRDPQD